MIVVIKNIVIQKLGSYIIDKRSADRKHFPESSAFRPTATAAYLHALRNHKPSTKMRSFVGHVEPSDLRGSNTYDPAWLWAGLGRRRR